MNAEIQLNKRQKAEAKAVRETVASNLKRWRLGAGLSQAEVSEKSGLSISYVSMSERGARFPSPEVQVVLCDVFKHKIADLYRPTEV